MRRWLVVVAMLGCSGAQTAAPRSSASQRPENPARDAAAAELIAATARGDVAATRAMLHGAVDFGGLWFEDTACRRQFSAVGTIQGERLDAFAACLATLRLARSERSNPYPDIEVLAYAPGIEIEILFGSEQGRPAIRWIGYVSRRTVKDALPTLTQRAFEAHRIAGSLELDEATRTEILGEHAASKRSFGAAWLKVCIDAGGAVTSVRGRQTTSLALQRALAAAIERWTFRPVILGGQPTPVCSLVWHAYPAGAAERPAQVLPFPVPPEYDSAVIVEPAMLKRIEGSALVVPDDDAKEWVLRRGIHRVVGGFFLCVTPRGTTDIVVTQRPSGVPRYDDRIRAAIRGWRYAPFLVDGQPAPVCTSVTFIYSQR